MFLHHCGRPCSVSEDRPVLNDSAIMCPGHGFVLTEKRSRRSNVSWLHLVAQQARQVDLSFITLASMALWRSFHILITRLSIFVKLLNNNNLN